ncbi:carbamate kinase [Mycoplasmopsis columbina]|uniref:Carbamate kinase n=1 Tax=Mycoplasmopsis columbina SF7 TaxID=1037410 RepID=F9UJU0_9BACT|nr:carbamate kinase [Mycoplasmopsis columbina]EGV00286.1 putative amino acid kinase [Mycoplasmopsis columbina SF7]VEU76849.1 carbamate kinase [Mycoplasmopsis columbina]
MSKIVIALGGNALGNNPQEQKELVKVPAKKVAELIKQGHQVLVGHGNGPQVGMIFNAFADAKKVNEKTPLVPFAEAGGMSQGYIGYHMLTAISNELHKEGLGDKDVLYFLTQTIVDANDKAFANPTKPVGPFYATKEDAEKNNPNSTIVEDAGRGYRKVVPSPKPLDVVGMNGIKKAFDQGAVVIAGGGGGIPTIVKADGTYEGVDGVIDKDFALAKIASKVNADNFIVLTAVDYVYVNYNKPDQRKLETVTVSELEEYIKQNQFAPGSMLPKVEAAIAFVKENKNNVAIIASLEKVGEAINGTSGTRVING